jgi:CHAD domain-containing protein
MSPVEAFLVIGRSILRHIAANESAVRRSDPEGVHQMRVGLRRLRGAMALFKQLLGDKQSERIKPSSNGLQENWPLRVTSTSIKETKSTRCAASCRAKRG